MKKELPLKDRIYKLKGQMSPLSYILQSQNNRRSPLMYFDGNSNRALRYASNSKTPYEDEQDGNVILEPIIFKNGMLHVSKNNPVLQHFLSIHPRHGQTFEEIDVEKDAAEELEILNMETEALLLASKMSISTMENVIRVAYNVKPEKLTSTEIKRDILVLAKHDPEYLLNIVGDPDIQLESDIMKMFDLNLVSMRNKNKDVYLNTKDKKRKLVSVPFGEDPIHVTKSYLQSDDGLEVFKYLKSQLK